MQFFQFLKVFIHAHLKDEKLTLSQTRLADYPISAREYMPAKKATH